MPIEQHFIELCKKKIYYNEKNKFGHAIIIMDGVYVKQHSKEEKDYFIQHIINTIEISLEISKKYNHTAGYVHIYLDNCTPKQYSHSFFKKINKILNDKFEDTLEQCYIYSKSRLFSFLWRLIRNFIDRETRDKVVHIKN